MDKVLRLKEAYMSFTQEYFVPSLDSSGDLRFSEVHYAFSLGKGQDPLIE